VVRVLGVALTEAKNVTADSMLQLTSAIHDDTPPSAASMEQDQDADHEVCHSRRSTLVRLFVH
jgi:hypothetical protein